MSDKVKCTFVLEADDKAKLEQLAAFSSRSESSLVRLLIRSAALKLDQSSLPTTQPTRKPEPDHETTPAG